MKKLKPVPVPLWFTSLALFLLLFSGLSAEAKLDVGPMKVEVTLPPGESTTRTIAVTNTGEGAEAVDIFLADWIEDLGGHIRVFKPGSVRYSLTRWVTITPTTFKLEPGESRNVELRINIPEDKSGPHWALAVVQGVPKEAGVLGFEKQGGKGELAMRFQYGVKIKQSDPTNSKKGGHLEDFRVKIDSKLKFQTLFKYTGTTYLEEVQGRIEIRDLTGEKVAELTFGEQGVLPKAKLGWQLEYPKDKAQLPPGSYLALSILDYGGDHLIAKQESFQLERAFGKSQ